uniref:Uncharacterized protein n=1 Tax=Acrobeloides nanus TaxID=290746 RepID=A0A914CRY4_9BILA
MAINQGLFQNRTIGALRSRVHYHWPQIVSKYGGESLSTYSDSDPSFFDQSNSNINISSSGLVEYIYGRPSTSNDMDLFDISSDIKEEQLDNDIIIEDCNLPVTGISEVSIPSGPSSVAIMTHFDTPISAPASRSGSEIAAPTSKPKHSPHELRKGHIKISQNQPAEVLVRKEAEYLLKTDRQKEVVDFVVVQPHVLCLIEEVHKHCC